MLYFRFLAVLVFSSFLSACSIEGTADKLLPDEIKQESTQIVDAIMGNNAEFFIHRKADLLPPNLLETISDEEFEKSIRNSFSMTSVNTEISRHIVGVKASVRASLGEGSTKVYETVHEIETSEGFVLITLRLANRLDTSDCCEIKTLDVIDFKASPVREGLVQTKKVFTVLGFSILGLIGILGFVFTRRRRRKKVSNI